MIVVRADIWPFGAEETARTLVQVIIANDGTGSLTHGNYDVWSTPIGVHPHIVRDYEKRAVFHCGRIEGFERGHDQSHVVRLVARALGLVPDPSWSSVNG